jgi:uncharacterized membrane protein
MHAYGEAGPLAITWTIACVLLTYITLVVTVWAAKIEPKNKGKRIRIAINCLLSLVFFLLFGS